MVCLKVGLLILSAPYSLMLKLSGRRWPRGLEAGSELCGFMLMFCGSSAVLCCVPTQTDLGSPYVLGACGNLGVFLCWKEGVVVLCFVSVYQVRGLVFSSFPC